MCLNYKLIIINIINIHVQVFLANFLRSRHCVWESVEANISILLASTEVWMWFLEKSEHTLRHFWAHQRTLMWEYCRFLRRHIWDNEIWDSFLGFLDHGQYKHSLRNCWSLEETLSLWETIDRSHLGFFLHKIYFMIIIFGKMQRQMDIREADVM